MKAFEVNFDGLIGPTHNYAGLSYGNIASTRFAWSVSNPRAAVLQGLEKMKLLADMGVKQAVMPPHERPDGKTLRRLGFSGNVAQMIEKAAKDAPDVLAACFSASSMWTANSATVSPSSDSLDGLVHFTPANLVSNFHRSMESDFTAIVLKTIFHAESAFVHHEPLPKTVHFSDEGAANHTRLSIAHNISGIQLFVYGRKALDQSHRGSHVYPARQTLAASSAIARLHRLLPDRTVFARQSPEAVDAGVFHNDVISVGNENLFLYHSRAFSDTKSVIRGLGSLFRTHCKGELFLIEVPHEEVPLTDAVESYLFNSQLVTLPDRTICLIAPVECRENQRAASFLARVIEETNPISDLKFVDLRQSMRNGGGPACLRLRVVLTDEEAALTPQGIYMTDHLYQTLKAWANRYYRDRLHPDDLADPLLPEESRSALDTLTEILEIGSIYPFQKQ